MNNEAIVKEIYTLGLIENRVPTLTVPSCKSIYENISGSEEKHDWWRRKNKEFLRMQEKRSEIEKSRQSLFH